MTEAITVSRRAVLTGAVAALLSAGLAHGRTPSNHLGRMTMNKYFDDETCRLEPV